MLFSWEGWQALRPASLCPYAGRGNRATAPGDGRLRRPLACAGPRVYYFACEPPGPTVEAQ